MNSIERALLESFRRLHTTQQSSALDYMDFLATRGGENPAVEFPPPLDIPRPQQESVVKAIKRLRHSYSMLDPAKLLHDTSNQMTRHLIHGVPASEVIDEMEILFRRHYEVLVVK